MTVVPLMTVMVPRKREDACARSRGAPCRQAARATKSIKAVIAVKPVRAVKAIDSDSRMIVAGTRIFKLLCISHFSTGRRLPVAGAGKLFPVF